MSFPSTYKQILRMIKNKVLDVQVARDIVRKAGAITGQVAENDLARGGAPWEAITKLSDEDFDVGWRKYGLGPDMSQSWNSGPPMNLVTLRFLRLRDSLLRSGTSNNDRFGYAFDSYHALVEPLPFLLFATYYERDGVTSPFSLIARGHHLDTNVAFDITDQIVNVTKDQARIICYVTRADYDYTFELTLLRAPASTGIGNASIAHTIDRGTATGRFVSEWLDFPESHTPERPYGHGLVTLARIGATDPPIVGLPPQDFVGLAEGTGPLCMPFFEVEVRTTYYAESSYWIQDDYTPEEWRVAQWENEVS